MFLVFQILLEFLIQFGICGEHGLYVLARFAVEVVLRNLDDYAAQTDHTDQVGDGHHGVEHIVQRPDKGAAGDGTDDEKENVDDLESQAALLGAEEIFGRLLAVVGPRQNGSEGEKGENGREYHDTECAEVFGKGRAGDLGLIGRDAEEVDKVIRTGGQETT